MADNLHRFYKLRYLSCRDLQDTRRLSEKTIFTCSSPKKVDQKMLTHAGVAFQKLPFMQDPDHFLRSYFWGCNEGLELSVKCKHQIEQSPRDNCEAQGLKSHLQSTSKIMDSVLDCYVHTQICQRCVSIEKVTCQQGYELMEERDCASDYAARMGAGDESIDARRTGSISQEQIQAAFNKSLAQEKFLRHKNSCEVCTLKRPKGRYSIAAWNIELARSHRLD
jgi:hypothetical protein